jgi:hypothetical protein
MFYPGGGGAQILRDPKTWGLLALGFLAAWAFRWWIFKKLEEEGDPVAKGLSPSLKLAIDVILFSLSVICVYRAWELLPQGSF